MEGTVAEAEPAVVSLVRADRAYCTGTLISPRVVITAAHCIVGTLPQVAFGSSVEDPDHVIDALHARLHPEFELADLNDDIGLLLLQEPAPLDIEPVEMWRPWRVTDPSVLEDAPVRILGFGVTGPGAFDGGVKREGHARIAQTTENGLGLVHDPAGPCLGDSGGPVLYELDGASYLLGVIAGGDAGCRERAWSTRVDAHAFDFIEPFLQRTAPLSADPGERCFGTFNCRKGWCVRAGDFGASYCAVGCSGGECPSGMRCVATEEGELCQPADACAPAAEVTGEANQDCGEDEVDGGVGGHGGCQAQGSALAPAPALWLAALVRRRGRTRRRQERWRHRA